MGSEKVVPFDVHSTGNISDFHLEQSVPKIRSPNQTCIILDVLANISGPGAYFSKPIFALKPWVQAGRFEYHKPHNRKNFFSDLYRGPGI